MKCMRCKSTAVMKFIDGFGERRIFCRSCGRSFLESRFFRLSGQKSLIEFNPQLYYRPQALRIR